MTATWQAARSNGSASSCAICGVPVDAQYFDDSSIVDLTEHPLNVGRQLILARFEVHPQYCGVLEYFSQYSDAFSSNNENVLTPGLEWSLLWNKRPLSPYLRFDRILNPWGFGSFQMSIRLPQNAVIELAVKKVSEAKAGEVAIKRVGGRILGRYWYDAQYGEAAPGRC